jgi:death-on-curing protein
VDEPTWLDRLTVDAMHHDQLRRHGGLFGTRDENALESALARPRHRWGYEPGTDLCALAAAYGFGLANNHAYIDGYKRIALIAMYTFLGVHGLEIVAPEEEVVQVMLDVASHARDEAALAAWLRERVEPYPG